MPYKKGRPLIDLSFFFRYASAFGYFMTIPIAYAINYAQHFTRYKNRYKLAGIKKAITVSNHTTFMDPVKVSACFLPDLIFQTLLEPTVEFPFLGTFTRILGGVPLPPGVTGCRKIMKISERAFNYRRFLHFYPEGECFLYNQKIMPFKPGAFFIAAELDIPVVPLVTVFREGPFKAYSLFGSTIPNETLVVMDPVYPKDYVMRNEKGEISSDSIRDFAEAVRKKMQAEIDNRGGTHVFYKGHMKRIKGLNDK